jgi:hypothetical protein
MIVATLDGAVAPGTAFLGGSLNSIENVPDVEMYSEVNAATSG